MRGRMGVLGALLVIGCGEPASVMTPPPDVGAMADAASGGDAGVPLANGRPVAADDAIEVRAGVTASLDVLANDSDPDGDALAILAAGMPMHGAVAVRGDRLEYTPEAGFVGEDSLVYVVSDGRDQTDDATVRLTVAAAPNHAPVAIDDALEATADGEASLDVLANDSDPDGDALRIASVDDPASGSASSDGARITYTPDAGFTGVDTFAYEIRDGSDASARATIQVRVFARPDAVDDVLVVTVDTDGRLAALANDMHADGLALSLASVGSPMHGAARIEGDALVYAPEAGFAGADSFTYTARDSRGASDVATVRVRVVPIAVTPHLAARHDQTLLLRADGSLLAWGATSHAGALRTPTPFAAGLTWAQVAMGTSHGCAIDVLGALYCWGYGSAGQLGLGADTSRRTTPERVGTDADWASVSAGRTHTCGVRSGELYCWGEADSGQLGLGDAATSVDVPTRVGAASGWERVSAGDAHACALRGGELWCWGENGQRQLGDVTLGDGSSVPARIGSESSWAAVSAGSTHSCGLRDDGSLWCWGRVPGGATLDAPTRVGTSNGWTHVVAGQSATCGVDAGALFCWGTNAWGQLGDGTQLARSTPTRVGTASDWQLAALGRSHACAMRTSGAVSCWGARASGRVGDGVDPSSPTPVRVGSSASDWTAVTAGGADYSCGLRADGSMWCWGMLDATPRAVPTQVGSMLGWALLPEAGPSHRCAMRDDGGLWCWGSGTYGRLGTGSSSAAELPQPVGGTTTFVELAAGDGHTCAITGAGGMQCWGLNYYGALGVPSAGFGSMVPIEVGTERDYVSVAAGLQHTCAVRADGTMWCWGGGSGDVPTRFGVDSDWREVRASRQRNCALRTSGALWCWTEARDLARIGLDTDWASVSVSASEHVCGVRTGGSLWCFGDNDRGQLGDGTRTRRALPVRVGSDADWADVAAGGSVFTGHSCGVRADGSLWCWGDGESGQLGDGAAMVTSPVAVDLE